MIQKIKKLFEKRALNPRQFIPLGISQSGGSVSVREAVTLSQIRRGLGLYRDLLLNSRLHAYKKETRIEDDEICKLFSDKPNRWQTPAEFCTLLVQDYFLSGDFFCHIFEDRGRVTALAPYPPESVFVYSKGPTTDQTNPVNIQNHGFFFQTSFKNSEGKTINSRLGEESIWHLRNLWGRKSDSLNGSGLAEAYRETVDFSSDVLTTSQKFSETGLVPPSVIKGVGEMPPQQKQELREELEQFFSSKSQFLTVSGKETLEPLLVQNPASLLMNLSSISSCNLARLLNLPVSLIDREDSGSDTSGLGLKEAHRFWVKTGGRAFLKLVAKKLSELSENRLEFAWRSTQFADMRESQALVPLVEKGLLTGEQAKLYLED